VQNCTLSLTGRNGGWSKSFNYFRELLYHDFRESQHYSEDGGSRLLRKVDTSRRLKDLTSQKAAKLNATALMRKKHIEVNN
jgi:hypothetical protein